MLLAEFGINADAGKPERQVISRFTAAQEFITAQSNLLNGSGWPEGCAEQFRFWADKNEHAILT